MDSSRRVAVIGAGAWGLSCALALLESGASNVRVYERAQAGSGSTALAAGLVSTHLRQTSDIALVLETRRRVLALRDWGRDAERPSAGHVYNAVGSVTIVPDDAGAVLERLSQRIKAAGGRAQRMDGKEVERRWPLAGLGRMEALYTKEDGHVEGGDLVDLLQARVRELGGQVAAERAATVRVAEGQAIGVQTASSVDPMDDVVVAAGSWSKMLLSQAALQLPVKAYRTQLAQLGYRHAGRFPILHDTMLYVYGRPDGEDAILMGDGTEFVESHPDTFNRQADQAFVEKIAAAASMRIRGGGDASYRRGWAGLCVATPDRDPLIGPYPGVAGLHVMVGDNGFGVMRSLALGAIAAERVLRPSPRAGQPYRPDRFSPTTDFEIREGFEL